MHMEAGEPSISVKPRKKETSQHHPRVAAIILEEGILKTWQLVVKKSGVQRIQQEGQDQPTVGIQGPTDDVLIPAEANSQACRGDGREESGAWRS